MELVPEVLTSGVGVIERYAWLAHKSFEAAFLQAGRGAVRYAISITPPATASGVVGGLDSGSEAKQRGYATIHRDLYHAFAPVRIKHKRREIISSGDLITIHTRLLAAKRPGAAMKRDRGQPYYVDVRKLRSLETDLRGRVGKLASGWNAAAAALNVAVPQWISRHGLGRGTFRSTMDATDLLIEATNFVSDHAPVDELRRRIPYAVRYALNDLERQIPYLNRDAASAAGLETAA